MTGVFRSEDMCLCQLFIQSESVFQCLAELGELGIAQFKDVNYNVNISKRLFVAEVRRCDEMERKLRMVELDIQKNDLTILRFTETPLTPNSREIIDLENAIERLHNDLSVVYINTSSLKKSLQELIEMKHVLIKSKTLFTESGQHMNKNVDNQELPLLPYESVSNLSIKFGFICGIIRKDKVTNFERLLWRACRGNAFLKHVAIEDPIEDPTTEQFIHKHVFMILFQGEQLKIRVKKLCEAFGATIFNIPDTLKEHQKLLEGINLRIIDLSTVIEQTKSHHYWLLNEAARNIDEYFVKIEKMKYIYHTMNLFNNDVTQKCLIGECWCPVSSLELLSYALNTGNSKSGSNVPSIINCLSTHETPPTYHRTNKVTYAFQSLVNAYGIATYKEINPAPFTIITFPFLFAVMFGDAGHGFIMMLFALWMIWFEKDIIAKNIKNDMWDMLFGGRYIIFLMGLFSIYTGFIYNDFFSKSAHIFQSGWEFDKVPASSLARTRTIHLDPKYSFRGNPYVFGIDPIWTTAGNKIIFLNSYKMKLSVIFGVAQMLFGVFLGLANCIFFRDYIGIVGEFIPQLLFLTTLFGYLDILIFYKWIAYTSAESGDAPSLLLVLINMMMFKKSTSFYPMQAFIQTVLVLIAIACVPWMLLARPLYKWNIWRKRNSLSYVELTNDPSKDSATPDEPFDFLETFIYQAIHTIEYCLGSISHTASYLRLWALSLAHSQLSEVLWNMIFRLGLIQIDNSFASIILYFAFFFWALLTVCILLIMEGLSAFLHALRLHWVEFQSKFYKCSGYPFIPFSFENIKHRQSS